MFLYFEHEKFKTFLLQLFVLNSEFLWQLQCKDINSRGENMHVLVPFCSMLFSGFYNWYVLMNLLSSHS
jgi:hypothetical protein